MNASYFDAKRTKVYAVVNDYARSIGLHPSTIASDLYQRVLLSLLFDRFPTIPTIKAMKRCADELKAHADYLHTMPRKAA